MYFLLLSLFEPPLLPELLPRRDDFAYIDNYVATTVTIATLGECEPIAVELGLLFAFNR